MARNEATVHLHVDGIPAVKARIAALTAILADRERELLELKGPCSNKACRLHYAHSGPCGPARVVEKRSTTIYKVSDGPKMLRETLCVAQTRIGNSDLDGDRKQEHMDRLQRLADECDRHRPLGPDGKHRDLHTPTCGCEDVPSVAAAPYASEMDRG